MAAILLSALLVAASVDAPGTFQEVTVASVLPTLVAAPMALQAAASRQPTTARAARPALQVEVTDTTGTPLAEVEVRISGPVERSDVTNAEGTVRLTNLRPGNYRLHFEHAGYVTLEREATVPASGRVAPIDVALTPAPAPPPPPSPPPATPVTAEPSRHNGEPRTLEVPAFTESNFIGRSEPQKLSVVGCTGYATTRVLQIRDPLPDRVNDDADETLYVVAGDATIRLAGVDRALPAGALAVIPRGTPHSITRRGRNPLVLISVLSGPPCQSGG